MSEPSVNLSLQSMYDEYYGDDDNLLEKRRITAVQSLNHIKNLWGDSAKVEKLLDVGAGEGSLLWEMGRSNLAEKLYGVEISASGVEAIKDKNISVLERVDVFDGYHIAYEDKYFDTATAIHVLEHVEHERLFLHELSRVAKVVIIEVPLEHNINIKKSIAAGARHGHINFYTIDTFTNLLNTSGLECQRIKIFTPDKDLDTFASGRLKGNIKYSLKSTMLAFNPFIAAKLNYCLCTAYCTAKS
jgi:predicted TPR repeat methyltransferase